MFFYMYTSSFVLRGSLHYICITHTHTHKHTHTPSCCSLVDTTLTVYILTLAAVWQSWPWALNSICCLCEVHFFFISGVNREVTRLCTYRLGDMSFSLSRALTVSLYDRVSSASLTFQLLLCTFISVGVTPKVAHDNRSIKTIQRGLCYRKTLRNVYSLRCKGVNVFT